MNWKNRLTNYNFWISLVSAVLLIMQAFNFEFDIANLSEIATALLGLLVVIGIISNPTKNNSQSKKENEKQTENKISDESKPTLSDGSHTDLKENIDSMPSGEQNEDNTCIGENDFKVLIDKISSDIAHETGIMKENVANVVNEIIKTYEEGDFMLDTENKEVENISEQNFDKEIINETSENVLEDNLDEIAEELLEKNNIEISEEIFEIIDEEYNEFKNQEIQEDLLEDQENSIESSEDLFDTIETEIENTDTEEIVEESVEENEEEVQEEIKDDIQEEITEDTQEEIKEEVISFKIVN